MNLNFFNITCFAYAAFAILTRLIMILKKDKWNQWELNKAYKEKKPWWIYLIAILSVLYISLSWYMAFTSGIKYGWILAALLSLTLVKISQLLFNYDKFREFVKDILSNKSKLLRTNLGVFFFSLLLIFLGLVVY